MELNLEFFKHNIYYWLIPCEGIGGSTGVPDARPPKGADSFVSKYKIFET